MPTKSQILSVVTLTRAEWRALMEEAMLEGVLVHRAHRRELAREHAKKRH